MESVNMTLTKNPNYYNISQNYTSPIIQSSNRQHQLKNISMKSNKIQPIAPAPPTTNSIHNNINITGTNKNHQQHLQPIINSVCGDGGNDYKKKYTYANLPYTGEHQQLPQSVARRNARERNRVKQVNNGFATLRQHIPQSVVASLTNGGRGASKKLSKVDTLRIAVEYISRLQELINNNESDSDNNSPTNSYHSNLSTIGSSSSNNYDYYTENQIDMKNDENFIIRSPSYSEISSSPSPSCSSDQSSIQSNQYYQMQPMVMSSTPIVLQQQFKYDTSYDNSNYNNNSSITETTPEDEELLDYISSWQEQQ